ncbi:hypothetical protein AX16_009183 [Volvariella volvacea WC 439]|nr:hypothetical protein AX16_009183 [Volvariella volvacea WC 439]
MFSAKLVLPLLALTTFVSADTAIDIESRHWGRRRITAEYVKEIFTPLGTGNSAEFFDNYVMPDVDWVVSNPLDEFRTNPLAGRYTSLADFRSATFNVVNTLLYEPIRLVRVFEPVITGNVAVVELQAQNSVGQPIVSKYGYAYDCRYAWVVVFNQDRKITHVRAYLDSAMVRDLVTIPEGAEPLPPPSN